MIEGLKALLGYFTGERHHREDLITAALMALYTAISETENYFQEKKLKNRRNRKKEAEIVCLWRMAAIPVRQIDIDLAERCLDKADHWLFSGQWSKEEIESRRIGLGEIKKNALSLLTRKNPLF